MAGRSHVIARTFDRVCAVLDRLGYLTGRHRHRRTGRRLGRLYTELDLLAAECLRRGLWDGLSPAELAACVSALVFESRQADDASPPRLPSGRVPRGPRRHGPPLGRARPAGEGQRPVVPARARPRLRLGRLRWARGARLESVLDEAPDLTPGDFVRSVKQLIDLLDQIASVPSVPSIPLVQPDTTEPPADGARRPADLGATARAAIDALRRGVITYSAVAD